MNIAYTIFI